MSRPLLALLLMVVFALLGAAFADTLWGPSGAGSPAAEPDPAGIAMVTSDVRYRTSGMIGAELARQRAVNEPSTTTARDL